MKTFAFFAPSRDTVYLWLLLCLTGLSLHAADLGFKWDASPDGTNYIFYASTNLLTVPTTTGVVARINVGTNLTASLQNLAPGRWYFGVTAQRGDAESAFSNILSFDVPGVLPPGSFRTVAAYYGPTVIDMTNVVGYFILKIK